MNFIKRQVIKIGTKHGTNDPFEIASQRNIAVLFEDLGEVFGYYNSFNRIHMIHINQTLETCLQRYVAAHELAHRVLHPHINTPYIKRHTFFSTERIEREANQFAVELLIPDELLREHPNIYEAATICGVPHEVVYLKEVPTKKRCMWKDDQSFFSV